jgi:lysophospholipase L1-like esterase
MARLFHRLRFLPVLVALLATVPGPAAAAAYPNSMASTGDSITRAFDSTWLGCVLIDCPQYSWSTGYSSTVNSHYRRILSANPAIQGAEYNYAKTGAKMADLDGQMVAAAAQRVEYVTVLMGANDVCGSSAANMTSNSLFEGQFRQALADFFLANPSAKVYVSSLPDIYQLWSVLHTSRSAQNAWRSYQICQDMLNPNLTEADRQTVVAQEEADNYSLQRVCADFPNCRWDYCAGYDYQFSASQVSTVDYFHPNLSGQNAVASLTWGMSYWGTATTPKPCRTPTSPPVP